MNIYIIDGSTDHSIGLDCNEAHVIAAASPRAARMTAFAAHADEDKLLWLDPRRSTVTQLSTGCLAAVAHDRPSIILTSRLSG